MKWIRGDTEESGDLARGCRRREIIFQRWGAGFSRKTFWQCFRQACVRVFSSFNVFLNSSNSVATLKRCGVFVSNSRQKSVSLEMSITMCVSPAQLAQSLRRSRLQHFFWKVSHKVALRSCSCAFRLRPRKVCVPVLGPSVFPGNSRAWLL